MSDFVITQNQIDEPTPETTLNRSPDSVIKRHPYLTLFIACLALNGILNPASGAFVIGIAAVIGLIFFSTESKKAKLSLSIISAVVIGLTITFSNQFGASVLLGFALLVGLLVYGLYLYFNKKLTTETVIMLLIIAGFTIRAVYIIYTDVGVYGVSDQQRQHDVFLFGTGSMNNFRHAEYIEWFYNNLSLPDFKPSGLSQFYHPPLHHFIAGMWLRFNTALGVSTASTYESIQVLTLFYSSSIMITMYKILKLLKFKGLALSLPLAFICFHPNFIIMSGSVNNDILSIALAFGAVLSGLYWYSDPGFKKIVITALLVGGAMAAKLSGALVAPAIAVLFLVKFVKSIKTGSWRKMIAQFCVFAVICAPIGLFWQIRNYIKYGLPITYVPALSSSSDQFLGGYSPVQRIFGLEGESFSRVFVAWKNAYGSSFNEYNMFIALIKTSIFGEFSLFYAGGTETAVSAAGNVFASVLFWTTLLLIVIFAVSVIWSLFKKNRYLDAPVYISMLLILGVILFSYVNFCFGYPQVCTQNFRYAVPLLIPAAVLFANFISSTGEKLKNSEAKIIKISLASVVTLFCVSSVCVYLLLGLM